MTAPRPSMELVASVTAGKINAIARLLSRAERGGDEVQAALAEIYRRSGNAHVIGITGVPGSGKSTLVNRLALEFRNTGRRVGIVAVDPSSPFSGGAILGDRIRMTELIGDPGIFIRSMATAGALGGLARTTLDAVDILDAGGFDTIFIETVGVGQDEIDVVKAAHTTVVVSAPGLGDDIQAIKAGVLEIADIHVVSKSDRSDAVRTIADLKTMLHAVMPSSGSSVVPAVIPTSAEQGSGFDTLRIQIEQHLQFLKDTGGLQQRRARIAEQRLLKAASELLHKRFNRHRDHHVAALMQQLIARQTHPHAAARQLIDDVWKEIQS